MLIPMVTHDQESYVTPYFNYLDLRNAMMPLMIPSVPREVYATAYGITW